MYELAFTETHIQKSPEEVQRNVPGASYVMHLAIRTDKPILRPSLHITCDGMIERAIPHARDGKPPYNMAAHKGKVFSFSFMSGSFEPDETMAVTIYSKTRIHVASVEADDQ